MTTTRIPFNQDTYPGNTIEIDDDDRENWVLNDESLYNTWMHSIARELAVARAYDAGANEPDDDAAMADWIASNRSMIDNHIAGALNQ